MVRYVGHLPERLLQRLYTGKCAGLLSREVVPYCVRVPHTARLSQRETTHRRSSGEENEPRSPTGMATQSFRIAWAPRPAPQQVARLEYASKEMYRTRVIRRVRTQSSSPRHADSVRPRRKLARPSHGRSAQGTRRLRVNGGIGVRRTTRSGRLAYSGAHSDRRAIHRGHAVQ